MDVFDRILLRWGFRVPSEYVVLSGGGVIDYENPNYLLLTHVKEWFIPARVEGQVLPDYWRHGFVPFAATPMGDSICWVTEWQTDLGIGTAFCVRSSSIAVGY